MSSDISQQPEAEPRSVSCPTCRKRVPWAPSSAWRPFCSKSCRLIDLGQWLGEEYRIPTAEDSEAAAEQDLNIYSS